MTTCEKCSVDFEETEMVLVQEDQIKFICKECHQIYMQTNTKVKPTPIKP